MARTLGHELKKVRQVQGLSLNAAAKPAGVSATYLQKLERDEVGSPSPHRLHRIATVLGIEYADLLRLAGYEVPARAEGPEGHDGSVPAPETTPVRKMFLSEEHVSDDELAELVRYLAFIREQRSTD
jgi:transcriptional regulator with XRE-family HTH domain